MQWWEVEVEVKMKVSAKESSFRSWWVWLFGFWIWVVADDWLVMMVRSGIVDANSGFSSDH